MTKPLFRIALFFSIISSLVSAQSKESGRPITIRAVEGLQFDPPRVKMEPGQTIRFRILNRDPNDLVHNLVLIKPGSLAEIQKASLQVDQAAIDRDYIPEHDAVLKHTKLLNADGGDDFLFTAPKEPGIYHYVCTFPGHATLMYGALYVGEKWGSFARDPNIPEIARNRAKEIEAAKEKTQRPTVKRFFLEKSGPAAIAVALENDLNYCWDAGNCRLRYAWSGEFFDLGNNSRSNGNRQLKPKGKEFWNGQGDELAYTIKTDDSSLKPDFKGYRLIKGQPEFKYQFGELSVTEFITGSSDALLHEIKISNATAPVKIYAKGKVTSNVGTRDGDYFVVPVKESSHIKLSIPTK
ncbi:plastocyanin/azurin family copper-binding protein [Akkermansiaceae bacterium]|nr:plastocyanin/azurin family copper-binding protein [Akkermansiaceae bacterium]